VTGAGVGRRLGYVVGFLVGLSHFSVDIHGC
ncbi:MAG: hypothetical protein ACI8RD_002534, partial [Bacillariaceae sp.]|jgi:hypothetical protein